jgi:hypothetical protein
MARQINGKLEISMQETYCNLLFLKLESKAYEITMRLSVCPH